MKNKRLLLLTALVLSIVMLTGCFTTPSQTEANKIVLEATAKSTPIPTPEPEVYTTAEVEYMEIMFTSISAADEANDNMIYLFDNFYPSMKEWQNAFLANAEIYITWQAIMNSADVPTRFSTYHRYLSSAANSYVDAMYHIAYSIDTGMSYHMDYATDDINTATSWLKKADTEFNKVKIYD